MARRRSQPVYYETVVNGLITCKILEVRGNEVRIMLTARRPPRGYRLGEVLWTNDLHVVNKTRVRNGQQYVRTAKQLLNNA